MDLISARQLAVQRRVPITVKGSGHLLTAKDSCTYARLPISGAEALESLLVL